MISLNSDEFYTRTSRPVPFDLFLSFLANTKRSVSLISEVTFGRHVSLCSISKVNVRFPASEVKDVESLGSKVRVAERERRSHSHVTETMGHGRKWMTHTANIALLYPVSPPTCPTRPTRTDPTQLPRGRIPCWPDQRVTNAASPEGWHYVRQSQPSLIRQIVIKPFCSHRIVISILTCGFSYV